MADSISDWDMPTARELLGFDLIGADRFRARRNLDNFAGATFGGQALGQALAAAQLTAPAWPANSLSGYFLWAGTIDRPIDYAVERVNDSRRFAARRVVASQNGRAIFDLLCSFHDPEPGVQHQFVELGDLTPPEDLANLQAFGAANIHRLPAAIAARLVRPYPFELRLLEPERYFDRPGQPARDFWLRMPSAAEVESPQDHLALLALMSDYWFPGAIGTPHSADAVPRSLVSLNHSLWFHGPVRADEWLLYRTESHWADHGRGLARGLIFSRDGRLVASAAQEGLMRPR